VNEQSTADSAERITLDEPTVQALPPPSRTGPSLNEAVERAFAVPSAFYARYPGFITIAVLGFFAAFLMSDLGRVQDWYGGEALPQRALAEEVIKGDFLPGGPYAGMPTHLPPLYPTAIGVASRITGIDPFHIVGFASVIAAILLPVVAYITGKVLFADWRPAAAGAVFVTFGAGFADANLGDSSLFTSGHLFAPLTPIDIGLLLIPLTVALFVRAAEEDAVRYGMYIGVIAAILAVIHLQSVIYLIAVILALGVAWLAMRPTEWKKVIAVDLTVAIAGLVLSAWWWGPQVWVGAREGGILIQTVSSAEEIDVGLGEWPSAFGLMLLLAALGSAFAVMSALRLKRLAPMLAVAWFVLLFLAGVFFADLIPEELSLRSDRLILLSTFPMGLLAGAAVTEWRHFLRGRTPGVYAFAAAVVLGLLVAAPTMGEERDLALAQTDPVFAGREWRWDGSLGFAAWFRDPENEIGTETFVADDPEAAIGWFFAGMKPLAWSPPSFYSMAYNAGETTGLSQTLRVRAQADALSGDWDSILVAANDVQEKAGVELRYAVVPVLDDRVALSVATAQQLATTSSERGREVQLAETEDGLSFLRMDEGGTASYTVTSAQDQSAQFTVRVRADDPGAKLTLTAGDESSVVEVFENEVGFWIEVPLVLRLTEGENPVQITAEGPVDLAAVYGFTEFLEDIPPGFRLRFDDGFTAIIEIPEL
jgi:hypothetical protein